MKVSDIIKKFSTLGCRLIKYGPIVGNSGYVEIQRLSDGATYTCTSYSDAYRRIDYLSNYDWFCGGKLPWQK